MGRVALQRPGVRLATRPPLTEIEERPSLSFEWGSAFTAASLSGVASTDQPRVTNFKRSTVLYNTAMRYNRGLDRDKDGIACEKR
jgi:Excalibur calcium-binding domain